MLSYKHDGEEKDGCYYALRGCGSNACHDVGYLNLLSDNPYVRLYGG